MYSFSASQDSGEQSVFLLICFREASDNILAADDDRIFSHFLGSLVDKVTEQLPYSSVRER